ncbi:DUF2071 domain-containing protein [Leptospira kirschneri]|uniref:Uncharacterized protein n=1 Tax=Leptospira kirschneri serovar Bulgarica str. Nikolaevo TaxID=1240687 RepID=M6F010_9LEPT|nr:DUF2071 domain-containing protein [Leptospira kirschneri]EMK20402.1 hypothetical protein LEP1GSC008_1502 [Leptospira kirschneri serovar Bulgarica str. Nikolaevo]
MHYENQFIHNNQNLIAKTLNVFLNNILFIKIKRIVFYPFTKIRLKSDIKNVVFMNWMVPIKKVEHLIPKHAKVRIYDDQVLFTILTYEHGNFRPTIFNKIKSIFGSPLQSNWRLYIKNHELFETSKSSVYFIKNIMNSFTYAIGSRVFSNILQTHLPEKFEHYRDTNKIITKILSGKSSAPDLKIILEFASKWQLPPNMQPFFLDSKNLIDIICNQEFAISNQPDKNKYAVAQINLQFNHIDIQPLEVKIFESKWLKEIISDSLCFAFVIKNLTFLTLGEKIITIQTDEP